MTLDERIEIYRSGIRVALRRRGLELKTLILGRTGSAAYWRAIVHDDQDAPWRVTVFVDRHFVMSFDVFADQVVGQVLGQVSAHLRAAAGGPRDVKELH